MIAAALSLYFFFVAGGCAPCIAVLFVSSVAACSVFRAVMNSNKLG